MLHSWHRYKFRRDNPYFHRYCISTYILTFFRNSDKRFWCSKLPLLISRFVSASPRRPLYSP